MSNINYKNLAVHKFKEMLELSSEYSLGEILYTVFRDKYLPQKPKTVKDGWLLDINDQHFYEAFERACKDYEPREEQENIKVIDNL